MKAGPVGMIFDQTKEFLDEGYVDEGADDGPFGHSQSAGGHNACVTSPLFYGDGIGDDPLRSDKQRSPGPDDTATATAALNKPIQQGMTNGLSAHIHRKVKDRLTKYHDIFAPACLRTPF